MITAAPSGDYDEAEENANDRYQDFGHSHWRNSLICGIGVRNVSISGRRPHLRNGSEPTRVDHE